MELKITKGEWVVDNAGDVIIKGSDGGVSFPARDGTIASINDGEYIENDNEHDAHLIAAAPDMYAMLKNVFDNYETDTHLDNQITVLLAKARGE